MKINETVIEITDQQEQAFASYVNYRDIDTSSITDADVTSDYEEADPIETLKKRLIHRLNYSVNEKGIYQSKFNETESYAFDFNNGIFTYSNRTSHYVYNWRGDQGGFGDTCTIDFRNGSVTEGCDESVRRKDMRAVISVIGKDRPGILAYAATECARRNINIEDVTQKVLDNIFTMIMIVTIPDNADEYHAFKNELESSGEEQGLKIHVMHEDIFNAMHRIG